MNTIHILDSWRVDWDGMQYILSKYDEGGKEYRNPKTGEMIISKAKWKPTGQYFIDIQQAVKYIIKQEVSSNASTLKEYLAMMEKYYIKLEKLLS